MRRYVQGCYPRNRVDIRGRHDRGNVVDNAIKETIFRALTMLFHFAVVKLSYFSMCILFVRFINVIFLTKLRNSGVPQVSLLDPILFLLDILNLVKKIF